MLGKLARDLRALGYDVAYAHHVEDDELIQRGQQEDRRVVTRDRHLADRVGEEAVLLETRDPEEQLERVIDALDLSPSAEAFLTRCLECNERLVEANAPSKLPAELEDQPHWRCPACQRVYWSGTHAQDMLDRLRHHLPDEVDRSTALDATPASGDGERKP